MGRKVTFDLDRAIETMNRVAPKLPGLLGMISTKVPGAASLVGYAELMPAMAELASDFFAKSSDKISGLPEVDGENGRSRGQYLRRRTEWTDDIICEALDVVLKQAGDGSIPVQSTLSYTERCLFGRSSESPSERRKALDMILDSDDAMSTASSDQLAAHLLFVLNKR